MRPILRLPTTITSSARLSRASRPRHVAANQVPTAQTPIGFISRTLTDVIAICCRCRYSPKSSTDSKEGDRPRVSFLQHKEATKPFLDLAARFPTVLVKYSKHIFHRTFHSETFTKLGQGTADRAAAEAPKGSQRDGIYAAVPGDLWVDYIALLRGVFARPTATVAVAVSRSPDRDVGCLQIRLHPGVQRYL